MEVFSEEFLLSNGFEIRPVTERTNYVHCDNVQVSTRTGYFFGGVEINLTAHQRLGLDPYKDNRTDLEKLFECIGYSFKKRIGD